MNHTVDWDPAAEIELTRIWLLAPDPDAVRRASDQIDRLLARNPHRNGRYLSEDLWQINVAPLAVSYTIDDVRRHVQVNGVRFAP